MPSHRRYLAVVLISVEPAWLALSREERRKWSARVGEILAGHPGVDAEWFDGDGLSGRYSDFVTCRFDDLEAYQFLWEAIRDEPLFSLPYMRIADVIMGRGDGYKAYEATLG